jgi:hypothetical protein
MVWKKVSNSDAGTATKHGGNDIDKIADRMNGVNVSDPDIYNVSYNTLKDTTNAAGDLLKGNGTKYVRFAKGTANQVLRTNGTGTDLEWATSTASGIIEAQNFTVYIEGGTYKARNGATGAIDFTHATDVTQVLSDIFTSVSTTTPLVIVMGKGDFAIRSWNEADFRHSNFAIIGQGAGITRFIVTNDIEDVAADSRAMSFESSAGSTTTNLTANATKGSPSISVTSAAGFAVGDDIILCSDEDWDTAFAGADRTQMNRIVSISGTTMMLEKYASETFNTSATARIIKQTVLRNIYLANFSIEAESGYNNTGTTFLRFDFCNNVVAENLAIVGVLGNFHTGLVTNMCCNCLFTNIRMELPASMGHFTTSGPYAISCRAACENIIFDKFQFIGGWRHCFTTTTNTENVKDGVPKEIIVSNCTGETCSEATFDTHGEGEHLYFINCAVNGYRSADSTDTVAGTADTDAFNTRGKYIYILNPMIYNCRGNGINITTQGHGIKIQGGYIRNIRNGFKAINISSGHDIQVSGISIDNVDKEAIYIDDSVYNVQISDVHITNPCTADNTLSPITGDPSSHDIILNNIMIDTSNDANIIPIKLDSTTSDYTLSNIALVGAGKDCTLAGFNHRLANATCSGRNLTKPLRRWGTFFASANNNGVGILGGNITATGGTRRIEPTDGLFQEFATSTTATPQGIRGSNNYCERDTNPYIRFAFRLETTSLTRMFLLLSNLTSLPTGADPLASQSGIGLKFASGGTNFEIYTNSGDATTTTGAVIASADTNKHEFEIRAVASANKFQYRFDFGAWTDITTDIPANNSEMSFQAWMECNESGVSKVLNLLEVETSIDNK